MTPQILIVLSILVLAIILFVTEKIRADIARQTRRPPSRLLMPVAGLIFASVGVADGMISLDIFTVIVGVVIVIALLTAAMLRGLFAKSRATA